MKNGMYTSMIFLFREIFGPLWYPFPQTSAAAEYVAFGVAHQFINAPTHLRGDARIVVDHANYDSDDTGDDAGLSVLRETGRRYVNQTRSTGIQEANP